MKENIKKNALLEKKAKLINFKLNILMCYFKNQNNKMKNKLNINKNIVSLIKASECDFPLKGETPDYMISVDFENRYCIKNIPLFVHYKAMDIEGEIAYDYDNLSDKNKEKFKDIRRIFIKNEDGYFYQQVREYKFKRKVKK